MTYYIVCTRRILPGHTGRITHVGRATSKDAKAEVVAEAVVIKDIESGAAKYYTITGGTPAEVLVKERDGKKFLTTSPDGIKPNNLESLKACP